VKALFMGQECTLNMVRAPISQNEYGWSVCGARTATEQKKWLNDFDTGSTSNHELGVKFITLGTNNSKESTKDE